MSSGAVAAAKAEQQAGEDEHHGHGHGHGGSDHSDPACKDHGHGHGHGHSQGDGVDCSDAACKDHGHGHGHGHGGSDHSDAASKDHGHGHDHGHGDGGDCTDAACTDHGHGHGHDHGKQAAAGSKDQTTAAKRFGIHNFVYTRRRPFHPQRLKVLLHFGYRSPGSAVLLTPLMSRMLPGALCSVERRSGAVLHFSQGGRRRIILLLVDVQDLVLKWLPVSSNTEAKPEAGDTPIKAVRICHPCGGEETGGGGGGGG